jgi:hypothetical protein
VEKLHALYLWIVAHWGAVSLAATVLVWLCNAATRHWSTRTGLVKVLGFVLEVLSPLTSKEVPGWFKWPFTSVSPAQRAMALRIKRARVDTAKIVLPLLLAASMVSACSQTIPQPRRCRHLDAIGALGGVPWDHGQCLQAQRRRNWLVGITAGLGVVAGAGGISAVIPEDSQRWRLAAGISSAVLAIGAAVLAPFVASAQSNLSEHCSEYKAVPK